MPKNIGQVKVAGDLLRELVGSGQKTDDIAVVLNDESLLEPLLNSLPPEIDALNISMGLPLSKTPLYTLINQFILMNENAVKFQRDQQAGPLFYYKDLARFLDHPFIQSLLSNHEDSQKNATAKIVHQFEKVFIDTDDLMETGYFKDHPMKDELARILEPYGRFPRQSISRILLLLDILKRLFASHVTDNKPKGQKALFLEYVFYFSKIFNRLNRMFGEYEFLNDLTSFRYLFTQLVRQESIPFYGEPLRGLQVMGMLETRMLDFKNLILLSVNEDFIPTGKSMQSFIPPDIRIAYQLPAYREREAVFAYHFYRLMQRAENIYLVYNTEAGDLGGGDKSRFIPQIELELTAANPNIQLKKQILSSPVPASVAVLPISIRKSEDLLQRIKKQAEKGFSVSALNVYRNCSLQFYYQYVARIRELDEVEETVEANTLGSVVHHAMQKLFEPHLHKNLHVQDVAAMQKKVNSEIRQAFAILFSSASIRYGKNHLIAQVAEAMVEKYLDMEQRNLSGDRPGTLQLLDLEQEIKVKFETPSALGLPDIYLKGIIDRVDLSNGKLRIIDYKTGKVEAKELKLLEWPLLLAGEGHAKTFQLLFYGLLYSLGKEKINRDAQAGIISFRNMKAGLIPLTLPENENFEEAISAFSEVLYQLFSDIFDPGLKFEQTAIEKNCEYCIYKQVCGR